MAVAGFLTKVQKVRDGEWEKGPLSVCKQTVSHKEIADPPLGASTV